jgi:hypothetical protein
MRGLVPALRWLRSYDRTWLRSDVVAGLTAAAVVVPQAMAYAAIAGLPLVTGLYTALVPLVVYAVMGTSRPLSVTTTSTIAILTAGADLGKTLGRERMYFNLERAVSSFQAKQVNALGSKTGRQRNVSSLNKSISNCKLSIARE